MKIPKELLEKMNEDDKAELEELTPNEEAGYQEMENYFNESLSRLRLPRSLWERSSQFPKASSQ